MKISYSHIYSLSCINILHPKFSCTETWFISPFKISIQARFCSCKTRPTSGAWHENKMVLVSKKSPGKYLFLLLIWPNCLFMAGQKFTYNTSVCLKSCDIASCRGFITRKKNIVLQTIFHCWNDVKPFVFRHVESQMTLGQTSTVLDE